MGANAENIEAPTLARRSFDSIKADIISGELAQGSKIVESDLALKYGISRGPLREAIHRLEQIKLIVRVPHAGSRVVRLDVKMMQDIYSAREALEGMAARLAARLMTDAASAFSQSVRISVTPCSASLTRPKSPAP